ncbi:MAG: hypothetical protein LBQ01_07335 [Prevotellaceae bacterium]|jgi:hypothetical protein|nr:hypothetical protein [Prevotellaceae bacterium]
MKNSDTSSITNNRFVALFDILGFKDRVMREPHEKIYADLAEIQIKENTLNEILGDDPVVERLLGVHIVKFSDSIILFSQNGEIESFIVFLISARFLFSLFLEKKFLIKGGMAYGNVSLDKEKQLYFGQPIIDAYLLEEDVNYIGVVVHNSIEEFIKQNITKDHSYYSILYQLIFEGKSPLKSGNITHFNLNWFPQLSEQSNEKDETTVRTEIIKKLKEYYLKVSGSPRRYIDNTITLINESTIDFKKLSLLTKQKR